MIFNPGMSGGGGKPELLYKSASKVESVDLTGIDWDAWSCVWILFKDGGDNGSKSFTAVLNSGSSPKTVIKLSDSSNYTKSANGAIAVYPHIGGDNPFVQSVASASYGIQAVCAVQLDNPCSALTRLDAFSNPTGKNAFIEIWGQP